jgi:hypothetical protein
VTLIPVQVALSLDNSWRLSVRKCFDRKRTHDWPFPVSQSDALTRLLLTPSRYIAVNYSMCGSILLVVCSSVWPDKTTYIGQDNNDMLLERMVWFVQSILRGDEKSPYLLFRANNNRTALACGNTVTGSSSARSSIGALPSGTVTGYLTNTMAQRTRTTVGKTPTTSCGY